MNKAAHTKAPAIPENKNIVLLFQKFIWLLVNYCGFVVNIVYLDSFINIQSYLCSPFAACVCRKIGVTSSLGSSTLTFAMLPIVLALIIEAAEDSTSIGDSLLIFV